MKNLIPFLFLMLLAFKSSAQTTGANDTTVYGSVQNNFTGAQEGYNKYLDENAKYPGVALQGNVQGCVYVQFVIEKDGAITNFRIARSVGSGMDDESYRLIRQSAGKWQPATINGRAVRTKCRAAIGFLLKANHGGGLYGVIDGTASDPGYLVRTDY